MNPKSHFVHGMKILVMPIYDKRVWPLYLRWVYTYLDMPP